MSLPYQGGAHIIFKSVVAAEDKTQLCTFKKKLLLKTNMLSQFLHVGLISRESFNWNQVKWM